MIQASIIRHFCKFYTTFLMPNRFELYRFLLESAYRNGYRILNITDFFTEIVQNTLEKDIPYLVLRHDIDSDPEASLVFAQIEEEIGVKGTYFFRKITWKDNVIATLSQSGHEIGYHNEEVADFCKVHHVKDKNLIYKNMLVLRNMFVSNLEALRLRSGLPIVSIASHGDVVNYKLDIGNYIILKDDEFRKKHNILYEAYDQIIVNAYQKHVSDYLLPKGFKGGNPIEMIKQKQTFCLLTHPRLWRRNILASVNEDLHSWFAYLRW